MKLNTFLEIQRHRVQQVDGCMLETRVRKLRFAAARYENPDSAWVTDTFNRARKAVPCNRMPSLQLRRA